LAHKGQASSIRTGHHAETPSGGIFYAGSRPAHPTGSGKLFQWDAPWSGRDALVPLLADGPAYPAPDVFK